PNAAAKKLLPKDILDDKAFYPSDQAMKNLEIYKNLGPEYLGIYNDLFLSIKMYRK
ncbi:MAG: spermidine/putrescine ABC transporter substrate-binding protein, partial [Lactococcus sp.]|nr:spermidine/putrescine ABC transporter substrate-binding protein [Lactococcus sp.]